MSTVVDDIRTFMAEAIAAKDIYLAWGRGDGSWTTPPAESRTKKTLVDAVGFRQVARAIYVTPDSSGDIIMSSGAFSISSTPTNHLYVEFRFDFADGQGETLREAMVYIGTTVDSSVPVGKKYLSPSEVTDVGRAALLEHFEPRQRSVGTRSTYEYVISL